MVGCGASAANQWLSRRPNAISVLLGRPVVEIRPAGEGRGLGMFAVHPIPAFSPILTDPPLILLQPHDDLPELYQHFLDLSDEHRRDFLSLSVAANAERDALLKSRILRRGLDATHDARALADMIHVADVTQTNAFNVDLRDGRGPTHRAVFPRVARINHSCAPNAHVCFHPPATGEGEKGGSRGRMVVHTLRALQAGEEVVIAYFNILLAHADRQDKARKWGFRCRCPVCAYELPESRGEDLRGMVRNFHSSQAEVMQGAHVTLREIETLAEFGTMLEKMAMQQPAMFPALPDLCDALGMLSAKAAVVRDDELQRGEIGSRLEQAALWEARITGPDSPATKGRLVKLTQFTAKKGAVKSAVISSNENHEYIVSWKEVHE